jgi:hypothetical protein
VALAAAVWSAAGCEVPIRAKREDPDTVYRAVNANALTAGVMSVESHLVLQRANLGDTWDSDPAGALARLHDMALEGDRRDRLYALAELSVLAGEDTDDRRHHLAAAVYAYLFLFGTAEEPPPDGYDHRFRLACDLYNRSVAQAFRDEEGRTFRAAAGRVDLPRGVLWLEADEHVEFGGSTFDEFLPAMDFDVRGLRARVRSPGVGAPLIAGHSVPREPPPVEEGVVIAQLPSRLRIPVTAFLRIRGELPDMGGESMTARLELHIARGRPSTTVRGAEVRLQTDTTAPIAYTIGKSPVWEFELASMLSPEDVSYDPGLYMLSPYSPGRIPLVLVHGTASSPGRWIEMINELQTDPVLAANYQVWLYMYPTGRAILASARGLRQGLNDSVEALDPRGKDPALRQMVVIGHSQGGLLTRLQVTMREELRDALYFEPVPHVARVVFMATPHRGSFLARGWLGRIGRSLVSIPGKIARRGTQALAKNTGLLKYDAIDDIPNAVDNMNPESNFNRVLATLPVAHGVRTHSVIPVADPDDEKEDWNDGVVDYSSAHLDWADSEKIVFGSGHSVQHHPAGIAEVRRILRLHVREIEARRR